MTKWQIWFLKRIKSVGWKFVQLNLQRRKKIDLQVFDFIFKNETNISSKNDQAQCLINSTFVLDCIFKISGVQKF